MASHPAVSKPHVLYRRSRYQWRRIRRFVVHNVLHADDPPHSLALGAAIGMFVALTPTGGVQMALVVFFAWLFRVNKVIGLPLTWVSNPFTAIPILYASYEIGRVCLRQESVADWHWWLELADPNTQGWLPWLDFYWDRFLLVSWPLVLGSVILASACGVVTYFVTYYGVRGYRIRRWGNPNGPKWIEEIPPLHAPGDRFAEK